MKRITRTFAMPARLAASLTLTACGSSGAGGAHDMTTMSPGAGSTSTTSTPSGPSAATAGTHNDPDVAFAKGMIPHHGQAVVMADLALEKADGEGFDRLWLQMMIKHHEGAVAMAGPSSAAAPTPERSSSRERSSTARPRRSRP